MEEPQNLPEGVSPEPETDAAPAPEPVTPAVAEPQAEAAEPQAVEAEPQAVEAEPQAEEPASPTEAVAAEPVEAPETTEPSELTEPSLSVEELLAAEEAPLLVAQEDGQLRAVLEAIIYVADEPLTLAQIAASLQQPVERIKGLLDQLVAEFDQPIHGVAIREVAGGYKMATKAEHHEAVRNFVKSLKPPLKLSLPALETLAVIAYKQPATGPEIMEIRGVQGGGVFKTLLDRKLIAVAGRKNVIGKPILYKTTKEFLIQFGLKDLSELPSLKEFEEIRRMAFAEIEPAVPGAADILPVSGFPEVEAPAEAPAETPAEVEIPVEAESATAPATAESDAAPVAVPEETTQPAPAEIAESAPPEEN